MKIHVVEYRHSGRDWEPIHASFHSRDPEKAERMMRFMQNEHPAHEYRVRAHLPVEDFDEPTEDQTERARIELELTREKP